jgi:hypothetical protein
METLANITYIIIIPFVIVNGIILYKILTKDNALLLGVLDDNNKIISQYVSGVDEVVNINMVALEHSITKAKIKENLEFIKSMTELLVTDQKALEDSINNAPMLIPPIVPITMICVALGIGLCIYVYKLT